METLRDIEIRVELHPCLKSFAEEPGNAKRELLDSMQRALDDLLKDLGIPARAGLEIRTAADTDSFVERTLHRMIIDGSPCRPELEKPASSLMTLQELVRLLTWEVFHNSDLLLSPSLCWAIRERWASGEESATTDVARIPVEDFRKLLLLMADRGNRIDRILDIDRSRDELGLPWVRRCFESAIVTDGATSINLTVSGRNLDAISQSVHKCTTELLQQMGVILPNSSVVDDHTLEETVFRIRLNDLRLPPVKALTHDELQAHLGFVLQRNVARFLTAENVQCSLDLLRVEFPAAVECARQRIGVLNLTAILRELLEESISIRDLRGILESLLQNQVWGPPQPGKPEDFDAVWHAGSVRADLKRYVTYKFSHGGTVFVYLLDPETESRLEKTDRDPLSLEERHSLLSRIIYAVDGQVHTGQSAVLLTKFEVRKKLWRLLATEVPSLEVLSFNELSPDVNIQPIGKI